MGINASADPGMLVNTVMAVLIMLMAILIVKVFLFRFYMSLPVKTTYLEKLGDPHKIASMKTGA